MQVMTEKAEEVRRYFENTGIYLGKDYKVELRSLVVKELLGDLDRSKILDVGAGDGRISLQFLSEASRITMIDISKNMLEIAKSNTPEVLRSRVSFINADIEQYELNEQYDVVFCLGVLAHVASVGGTVEKMADVLTEGGRCIMQITDAEQMLGKLHNRYNAWVRSIRKGAIHQVNRTTISQIVALGARNGLQLVSSKRYSLLLPGMGRLPNRWLFKFEHFIVQHPWLSRYGSGAILLFKKAS